MSPHVDAVLQCEAVARLRALLGDRPDAMVAVENAAGELLWASQPGAAGLLGCELSEVQGTSRCDCAHPDDVATCRSSHEHAMLGETVRYTARVLSADGDWRRVSTVMWRVESEAEPLIVSVTVPAVAG